MSSTRVIVPISGSVAELDVQARSVQATGADLIEMRLDRCPEIDEAIAWIPRSPLPVLATIRHADEGGGWAGQADRRAGLLLDALSAGAAMIDVELAHWQDFACDLSRFIDRLILSYHDFTGPGVALAEKLAAMRATGAAVAKIAVTARDAADLAVVKSCIDGKGAVIALAMGEHGLPSRLLAGAWGAWATFARLDGSAGSAPGQPTTGELLGRYRLRAQRATTRVYGVIGSPIAHSLSPHIHNACLAERSLDAVYVPFRVDDAPAFWNACGSWISGLSITIPHKQALQPLQSHLEPLCDAIGAMNTIYRKDVDTIGANTDADAIHRCLERPLKSLDGRTVLVLGAGGVARAIAFAVRKAGARCLIANRTHARAVELATEVGAESVPWADLAAVAYDALVNGTSVGMGKPDETPWPHPHRAGTVVFDTVYTPLETRLIRDARAAGCTVVLGLEMFVDQAEGQWRRWFGDEPPAGVMRRIAEEELRLRQR